jgi:hypothetical protein
MATIGYGVSHKDTKQINAAQTKYNTETLQCYSVAVFLIHCEVVEWIQLA